MPIEYSDLAKDHWQWTEGLISRIDTNGVFTIEALEYIYLTAFDHGFKHGYKAYEEEMQAECDASPDPPFPWGNYNTEQEPLPIKPRKT